MTLYTNRLYLREIVEEDIPQIHQLNSIPEVDEYNTLGLPMDITETERLIRPLLEAASVVPRERFIWAIEDHEHNFMGLIGLNFGKPKYQSAELWYKLHPHYWNKGFATEAVNGVLVFSFNNLKLHRVKAGCATANTASIKVLQKAGFLKEGHHRRVLPIRGVWVDGYEFAILEDDYEKLNGRKVKYHENY